MVGCYLCWSITRYAQYVPEQLYINYKPIDILIQKCERNIFFTCIYSTWLEYNHDFFVLSVYIITQYTCYTSLYHNINTSLHHYVITSLYHYILTSLHHYIITCHVSAMHETVTTLNIKTGYAWLHMCTCTRMLVDETCETQPTMCLGTLDLTVAQMH